MKAALEYRPDVVLLDIGLPLVDGFAVAKRLGQEPALGDVVLVALTGYGQESDRQQSREAGFDHHLVKPVDFAKIENILVAAAPNAG
jgi:CheY-like chemotaxis protein